MDGSPDSYIAAGMRFIYFVGILTLLTAVAVNAQVSRDVRSISLAGSDVADSRSNIETNPAYLTPDSGTSLWTRLTPTANYIDGAFEATAAASVPLGDVQIGAALDHLGFQDIYAFNEMSLDVSTIFGKDRTALAGIRMRYHVESYGPTLPAVSGLAADIGSRVEPIRDILLGADVINLISPANIPRAIDFGLGYRIDESILLASTRLEGTTFGFAFGAEVPIATSIVVRAGTSTSSHLLTGGVDFRYDSFHVDLGFQKHPDLGTALSFGLRWEDI